MLTARRPRRVPNWTLPVDQREQRVVAATADALAGVEVGAALADDDLARVHVLAAEALHAEPLGVGVAAVAAGRRALLVCHLSPPSPLPRRFGDRALALAPWSSVPMPVIRTWVYCCR